MSQVYNNNFSNFFHTTENTFKRKYMQNNTHEKQL